MRTIVIVFAAALFATSMFHGSARAADPAVGCEAGKLKEAATYAACRLKAEATAVKKATTPDYSKCEAKFTAKFPALEAKAGLGVCPSEGDAADVDARIKNTTDTLATLLSGQRYQDCGDGTVADLQTGLVWTKTDDAGGRTDKDNLYTWTTAVGGEIPDGTLFLNFLAGLNGALTGTTCYTGHCDWRIPTVFELVTTLLDTFPCATNPCIDQGVFGPMNASATYHTNTSLSSFIPRLYAYTVYYQDGDVDALALKNFPAKQARGVRSGSCD